MAFDANLVLMDGSVVSTTVTDTPAISTTRDAATGAAVLDLQGTGKNGLVAVMTLSDLAGGADAYTLTAYLQASDTEDMTGTATGIERLGSFQIASATTGVIIGSETPNIALVYFATNKRYLRINATVSNDFGYITVLVTRHPFIRL